VSVQSKSLDSTKQAGEAALKLIQSSAPSAPANTASNVGQMLNIVA
jgi:hypothetical protein